MHEVVDVEEGDTYRGPMKVKAVRDYSMGSIADRIARIESVEELTQARDEILKLYASGAFSRKTARRIERVANARYAELSTRSIQTPPSGKLFVPKHLAGGSLIVKPGE